MRPYRSRPVYFAGVHEHRSWRLKRYAVRLHAGVPDWRAAAPAFDQALAMLPQPAVTAERAGVGFVILHEGAAADYVVLAWWDRENELPLRIFLRDHGPDSEWRPAAGSESICVWDLDIIACERAYYLATVLAEGADSSAADAYIALTAPVAATAS